MTINRERLRELAERMTLGPWRVGADLCRVHPHWKDEHGNASPDNCHRNGFAKTIATVGKEDGDWRPIEQMVSDAEFIVLIRNALPEILTALDWISAQKTIDEDQAASGIPTEGGDNSLAPFMGSPPEGDAKSSPTRSTLLSQDKSHG